MKHKCVWCIQPVTRPQWMITSGMKLPYHPSCYHSLQEALQRNAERARKTLEGLR